RVLSRQHLESLVGAIARGKSDAAESAGEIATRGCERVSRRRRAHDHDRWIAVVAGREINSYGLRKRALALHRNRRDSAFSNVVIRGAELQIATHGIVISNR